MSLISNILLQFQLDLSSLDTSPFAIPLCILLNLSTLLGASVVSYLPLVCVLVSVLNVFYVSGQYRVC